jgi:SAM-dependent methyltransferase
MDHPTRVSGLGHRIRECPLVHPSVQDWVQQTLTAGQVAGKTVLEVGSYDVNGSVRPYVESLQPRRYLGVDVAEGPSVDQVVDYWDVVICTEMLEHVADWRPCVMQLARATAPGGLLLITTRSPGFPYHPFPDDHWRFTIDNMIEIMDALNLVGVDVQDDPDCPGVFVLARKPAVWAPTSLNYLTVAGVA